MLTALAGEHGSANAISNGNLRYIVGKVGVSPQLPVRWTIAGGAPSQPAYLSLGGAAGGFARGVNDAGQTVGTVASNGAIWDVDGNLTLVSAPSGFTSGSGGDINNDGHAVFNFSRPDAAWPGGISTGNLRLSSGELIELLPVAADGMSLARSVSSVTSNLVTIAGSSYSGPSSPRAVRWTVDIAARQVVGTEVLSTASHGLAVGDNGAVAGWLIARGTTAFRWQGSEVLSLNPPKGARGGVARAISPNGLLVAGEANVQNWPHAILWRISSP